MGVTFSLQHYRRFAVTLIGYALLFVKTEKVTVLTCDSGPEGIRDRFILFT